MWAVVMAAVVGSNDDRFGPLLQKFGDKGSDRIKGGGYAAIRELGTNYRMSEPQAAVAAAQLDRLERIAERRAPMGMLLTSEIAGAPGFLAPRVRSADRCTFWFYLARVDPRQLRCDNKQFARAPGRYRNCLQEPALLEPGKPTRFRIRMGPTSIEFRAWHRIRVDITSSDYPNYDRNHNTAADQNADSLLQRADQRVLHGGAYPSRGILPVGAPSET